MTNIGDILPPQTVFQFKPGDRIIGVGGRQNHYGITKDGWIGYVESIVPDDPQRIGVSAFPNSPADYFDVSAGYFMPYPESESGETEEQRVENNNELIVEYNNEQNFSPLRMTLDEIAELIQQNL